MHLKSDCDCDFLNKLLYCFVRTREQQRHLEKVVCFRSEMQSKQSKVNAVQAKQKQTERGIFKAVHISFKAIQYLCQHCLGQHIGSILNGSFSFVQFVVSMFWCCPYVMHKLHFICVKSSEGPKPLQLNAN